METEKSDPYEDNRDVSRQSCHSTKKSSRASSLQKHKKNVRDKAHSEDENEDYVENRSKTRTCHSDPDRDRVSDEEGRRSSRSFYSEDYENESPSDRCLSPYSTSRTPSPVPLRGVRTMRNPRSPLHKIGGGVGRHGLPRTRRPGGQPLNQQYRRGGRSQSNESTPPKDLDLVTKRMLSARLIKINELRNALAELQQRMDELQKENRILKQLQVRQEKALQRYDDTESEISQLLSRHSNDMHVLRERLRRTQERERAAEKRSKDSEEQLQRSQATIARLKKLVNQRELGERDELNRKLEEEKRRAQEAEHKIKELERSIELSNSSYQRQLVAEKKKTISAQEAIGIQQEELERITSKLREKERELDTKNIYANRMVKSSLRKEANSSSSQNALTRSSTKCVQTEDRTSSLGFPTPPPAISDANDCCEQAPDEYLSLKDLSRCDKQDKAEEEPAGVEEQKNIEKGKGSEKEKELEEEQKQPLRREMNILEEKAKRLRDGLAKEKDEDDRKMTSSLLNKTEEESHRKRGHVQEEVVRWNQESLANQQAADEARRRKELLLAKMREIDRQNQATQDSMFVDSSPSEPTNTIEDHHSFKHSSDKNRNFSSPTKSEDFGGSQIGSKESGRRRPEGEVVTTGIRRRTIRSQVSNDVLAHGNYAPSFGNSSAQVSPSFPSPPPKENRESALEAIGVFSLRGVESEKDKGTEKEGGKDKKSSLMQQLFGAQAASFGEGQSALNKREVFHSPPAINSVRSRNEGLFSFGSGSSTPPVSSITGLHVAESRPAIRAIRAITSFDDDLEELTL